MSYMNDTHSEGDSNHHSWSHPKIGNFLEGLFSAIVL